MAQSKSNRRAQAKPARSQSKSRPRFKPKLASIGRVYIHKPSGRRYQVVERLFDATGYERTGRIVQYVRYKQLDAGHFPAGTLWVRAEQDFLEVFV